MRKKLKFFVLPILMLCFTIVFSLKAAPKEPVFVESYAQTEITNTNPTSEEDGLYCSIRNKDGKVIASCWFCSCKRLAEAMKKSQQQ